MLILSILIWTVLGGLSMIALASILVYFEKAHKVSIPTEVVLVIITGPAVWIIWGFFILEEKLKPGVKRDESQGL